MCVFVCVYMCVCIRVCEWGGSRMWVVGAVEQCATGVYGNTEGKVLRNRVGVEDVNE